MIGSENFSKSIMRENYVYPGMDMKQQIILVDKYKRMNSYPMLPVKREKDGTFMVADKDEKNIVGFITSESFIEDIKKSSSYLFDFTEKFDKELFLAHFSDLLCFFKRIQESFEAIYKENPEKYYSAAIKSQYYSSEILNAGSILLDYSAKRIFSVLLLAESDDEIRNRVEKILYSKDRELKKFIHQKSYYLYDKATSTSTRFLLYSYTYLLLNNYGFDNSALINYFLYNTVRSMKTGIISREEYKEIISSADISKLTFASQKSYTLMSKIRTFIDIYTVCDTYEYAIGKRTALQSGNLSLSKDIQEALADESDKEYLEDVLDAAKMCSAIVMAVEQMGFRLDRFMPDLAIKDTELVLRIFVCQRGKYDKSHSCNLTLSNYIYLLLILLFFENEKLGKKEFFQNNNETMFSAVSELNNKLKQAWEHCDNLQIGLQNAQEECTNLVRQIEALNSEKRKEAKDVISPYLDELARQRAEIESLKKQLKEEQKKNNELHTLREFAFDTQSEYVPENTTVDFNESIKGKKVVVIGGHINWRNKLKKKYPELIIYDGHTETADITPLRSADFVFLNVSNMSHGMYYKVIDVLRESNIAYDYLGRTINQELYEKEMADILMRHKIGQNT